MGKTCSIPRPLKRVFFRALLTILNTCKFLGASLKNASRAFVGPVFWLLRKIYRRFVVPTYSFSLTVKKRWQKLFGPAKNKFFYPFIAKPVVHIVVIVLIFSVTAVNIQAQTAPVGTGENSLLFGVLGGEDLELIEETADVDRDTVSFSYVSTAYGISSRDVGSADVTLIPVADNSLLVTTGETAIATTPSITGAVRDTSAPRKVRTGTETYIVKEGDTISTIAASFGLSSSTILWANDLGSNDFIRPGQELAILPVDGVTHEVTSGDTLTKIASRYGVEEEDISSFNKLGAEGTIALNTTLIIPDGTPPRPTPQQVVRIAQTPTISDVQTVFEKPDASPNAASPNMLWPVPGRVITQYWGWRHTGVDIDGHYDDPIYASDAGVVEIAGWGRGYGIQAVVNHENGFKTRYAHMSKIFVTPGQRVAKGEVLGMVGTTGYSTGTHIHYEIYVNGVRKNPLLYIK